MRALITGGTGAIGTALVKEFSTDYEVIFTYLNKKQAALELEMKTCSRAVKCDVRDREGILKILNEYPHFDLLINNAGISQIKLFTDTTADDWNNLITVNLTGAFNVTQAVIPSMLKRKTGVIVNISSIWGEIGASCEVAYSASKAGLIGMTKALAKEVEPSGIKVFYIAPGAVESPMNSGFTQEELLHACPCGKVEKPEDVSKAIRKIINKAGEV